MYSLLVSCVEPIRKRFKLRLKGGLHKPGMGGQDGNKFHCPRGLTGRGKGMSYWEYKGVLLLSLLLAHPIQPLDSFDYFRVPSSIGDDKWNPAIPSVYGYGSGGKAPPSQSAIHSLYLLPPSSQSKIMSQKTEIFN